MNWAHLSIIHSILVAFKILYIKYDTTPSFIFPIIINIIVGVFSLLYFILYYNEHFTNEFVKPKYYIFSIGILITTLLGFYIIKICPNPAYFRVFVSLQIIILLFATMYINNNYNISMQTMIGILCGCTAIILISLDENNK